MTTPSPQPLPYQGTTISEAPDHAGSFGQAWRVTMPPPGERSRPDEDGTLGIYIVRAPNRHPFWDHWVFTAIHLRPIEGVRPAHIAEPDATHELMIAALDPGQPLPSTIAGVDWQVHTLRPIDVVQQFQAKDDATADHILELAVRAVVDGNASPDQDWRRWWKVAITSAGEYYAAGRHVMRLQ